MSISMVAFNRLVGPTLGKVKDQPNPDRINELADSVYQLSMATKSADSRDVPTLLPSRIITAAPQEQSTENMLGRLAAVSGLDHQNFYAGNICAAAGAALQVAAPFALEKRQQVLQGGLAGVRLMAVSLPQAPVARALVQSGASPQAILTTLNRQGNFSSNDLLPGFQGIALVAKNSGGVNVRDTARDVARLAQALEPVAPSTLNRATIAALKNDGASSDFLQGALAAIGHFPGHKFSERSIPNIANDARDFLAKSDQATNPETLAGVISVLSCLAAETKSPILTEALATSIPADDRLNFIANMYRE